MVHPTYNRSDVLTFNQLDVSEQEQIRNGYDFDDMQLEEESFVIHKGKKYRNVLPLSMFVKCNWRNTGKSIWDGIYSTSYFSAYFIKFNRSHDECVIAERFA